MKCSGYGRVTREVSGENSLAYAKLEFPGYYEDSTALLLHPYTVTVSAAVLLSRMENSPSRLVVY